MRGNKQRIYIAGHNGMVGGALVRRFRAEPGVTLVLRTRKELDLTSQAAVAAFLAAEKPDTVIMAAAKVGGIHANNTYPADFIYQNLMMQANVIATSGRAVEAAGDVDVLLLDKTGTITLGNRQAVEFVPMRTSRATACEAAGKLG